MNHESLFTGKNHISYESTDSTNTRLKELLLLQSPPEGTIVTASYQEAGRGQRGAGWDSEPGQNILFSLLLYPKFLRAEEQIKLSQAVALGVLDFISHFVIGKEVKIKWPNDIYAGDEKIAGMLIENSIEGHILKSSIIGIGININQEKLVDGATSFFNLTGIKYVNSDLIPVLCSFLEKRYLALKVMQSRPAIKDHPLHEEYLANLYGLGIEKKYMDVKSGKIFAGIIENVSSSGKLQLRVGDKLREYDLKEIRFLLNY